MRSKTSVLELLGLASVLALCVASIAGSEAGLPAHVITKWANGHPTHSMPREDWIASAIALALGPALLMAAVGPWSARRWPLFWSVRLARATGDERTALVAVTDRVSRVLAGFVAAWLTGFHFIVVRANSRTPPRLEAWPIVVWVLVFMVFLGGILRWHFRLERSA